MRDAAACAAGRCDAAVKVASLGKVSGALCEVGGIYRRNM